MLNSASTLRACVSFAWANLVRGDRLRFLVATAGATGAVFIILLHLAFLRAVEHKATQVYALFDADIAIVSDRFQFLYRMSDFPVARLRQALSLRGIDDAAAVRIDNMGWVAASTQAESSLLLIGVDPLPAFIADAEVREGLQQLRTARRILFDRRSNSDVGALRVGDTGSIGSQPATIAGLYSLGLPMYAAATAIVANTDFLLYTGADLQRIQLGLLRLSPGIDARHMLEELKSVLPNDVRVLAYPELMEHEADYFLEVKPLGIMMRVGLLVGLLVGSVALFQVMSSQIDSRMRDLAVLRAMGFGATFTYAIGGCQLALMGMAALALAWLAAVPVFGKIADISRLSMPLDASLLAAVFVLLVPMLATAAVPLLRAGHADPAALF